MSLPGKFFLWPYAHDLQPAIDELRPVFLRSVLAPWCGLAPDLNENAVEKAIHDTARLSGDLVEFIALLCRVWDVNPWWIVVSGQREQSIFTRNDLPMKVAAAWLGYVGQDKGRTTLPAYYGLYAQVERAVQQAAWYMNVLPDASWPEHSQKDHSLRYTPGATLLLEREGKWKSEPITNAGDWIQLEYTPHPDEVLPKNLEYAKMLVPEKYLLP